MIATAYTVKDTIKEGLRKALQDSILHISTFLWTSSTRSLLLGEYLIQLNTLMLQEIFFFGFKVEALGLSTGWQALL